MNATTPVRLGALLQQFFLERLLQQRRASTRTINAYRDSFRRLLAFAQHRLGKPPSDLALEDLNAAFVLAFLQHLEKDRHNSIRSRNARFAAIRSFMHYVALKEPAAVALSQAVLAIPMKRFERRLIGFLSREHMQAILEAPEAATWSGQRDRVMFATLYNTGARVSELIGMRIADLSCAWLRQYPRDSQQPLFINRRGGALTRIGITERLQLAAQRAAILHPQLATQRVSPHLVRHSLAMHMLQSGVDITVIALWLGHESPTTTHMYVEADLQMKQRALKALQAPRRTAARYRPPDRLLQFLQSL